MQLSTVPPMTLPQPQTAQPSEACHTRAESARGLAARIRLGDEDAFAALFLEHYTDLCQFVDSYVRAPDIAEEIVQAVFLRIWEHRGSWDPRGSPRAYLFASCRNQAVDALRHEQIVAQSSGRDAYLGIGRWSAPRLADAELEAAELADRLRSVVAELPERRQLVVILDWERLDRFVRGEGSLRERAELTCWVNADRSLRALADAMRTVGAPTPGRGRFDAVRALLRVQLRTSRSRGTACIDRNA